MSTGSTRRPKNQIQPRQHIFYNKFPFPFQPLAFQPLSPPTHAFTYLTPLSSLSLLVLVLVIATKPSDHPHHHDHHHPSATALSPSWLLSPNHLAAPRPLSPRAHAASRL